MPNLFPNEPAFQGPLKPCRFEGDIVDVEYSGEIPAGLEGCFYRCGADPRYVVALNDNMLINGDGVVTMFKFDGSHVDFKIRYVRTKRFLAEEKARRALFGEYRNPFTDDESVADVDRTTANTSVIWYAGKLLAVKEDGLPYILDPMTLETLGQFDFRGDLKCPTMTAHPETDPETDQMWFYGYEAGGLATPDTVIYAGDKEGNLLFEHWFEPPYAAMIHDFAITQKHVVLPLFSSTTDVERLKAGGAHWAWDPSKPACIGIMPRDGSPENFRWFEGPARHSFHTMNAFDDGAKVHFDTTIAKSNAFFADVDGNLPNMTEGDFYLTRITCDLAGDDNNYTETRLYEHPSDFYVVDPRYRTKPYRHGFMVAKLPVDGAPSRLFNAVVHVDLETGKTNEWRAGPAAMVQEPIFVSAGDDAAEGEGWILAVVNRLDRRVDDVVILDAMNLEAGPVATLHLPLALRMTFHGEFVSREKLDAAGAWS